MHEWSWHRLMVIVCHQLQAVVHKTIQGYGRPEHKRFVADSTSLCIIVFWLLFSDFHCLARSTEEWCHMECNS